MRLTTARYFTPSGRSIQGKGIEPDIEVPQAKIEVIEQPARRREAELKGALSNPDDGNKTPSDEGKKPSESKPPEGQTPENKTPENKAPDKAKTPESKNAPSGDKTGTDKTGTPGGEAAKPEVLELGGPNDYQLARAVDLLHGLALAKQRAAN